MNRRKALLKIFLGATGLTVAVSGYKYYEISKVPDFDFLTKNSDLIGSLADLIIPATNTPGALESGVGKFIIKMIKDCASRKSQNNFIDGLKDLEAHCIFKYNELFQNCSFNEKQKIMGYFENKGVWNSAIVEKIQNRILGKPFFSILKEYTVEGFCTSKNGATKALIYDYVPGKFNGCVTLKLGQVAWATN